jgi:hypothetical protein
MAILNCSFNNHFEILKIRFIVLRNAHQKVMGCLNSHPTGHQIKTCSMRLVPGLMSRWELRLLN